MNLAASDAASGVDATYYKLDGGAKQTYREPSTSPDGSHTVTYWSVDKSGNVEATSHGLRRCRLEPPTRDRLRGRQRRLAQPRGDA